MADQFDPAHAKRLEDPARLEALPQAEVVVAADIRENVFGALQRLVGVIKKEVVTESEYR